MKKLFILALIALGLVSCDNKDDSKPFDSPVESLPTHFDVWVSLDGTTGSGGQNQAQTIIVQSVPSLDTDTKLSFEGIGADVTSVMDAETMIHGKYYYQVAPLKEAKFAKYQITNQGVQLLAEHAFGKNTYAATKYCADWINDSTFVVVASANSNSKVVWSKVKEVNNKFTILAEGEFNLSQSGVEKYSTSGLARYRKADNTLIYLFCDYSRATTKTNKIFAAFVNPDDMSIKSIAQEDRSTQLSGTVYGELLQNKTFFDENGNLYVACGTQIPNSKNSSTCSNGRLYRINAGASEFDASYLGFDHPDGKIVTVDYLGNNKVLLYLQDPKHCGTAEDNSDYDGWGSKYNCYYAIYNLQTNELTELEYNGEKLPYCLGTFSQRSIVREGKAYIGVNPREGAPVIYVYDIATGKVTKGMTIQEGYEFNRIVVLED